MRTLKPECNLAVLSGVQSTQCFADIRNRQEAVGDVDVEDAVSITMRVWFAQSPNEHTCEVPIGRNKWEVTVHCTTMEGA